MIDIQNERLISMPQAAAMLPNRPSLCALWRWRTKGYRIGKSLRWDADELRDWIANGCQPIAGIDASGNHVNGD